MVTATKPASKTAASPTVQTFTALLDYEREGSGSTGFFEVPAEVVDTLGQGKKRLAVVATINGFDLRTTISVYGGKYYIPARREVRAAAGGIKHGDRVTVHMCLDDAPRVVETPAELETLLKKDVAARAAWDRLAFSHKKEYVLWITEAKREETKTRRLEQAIVMLREGSKGPKA
jgi:hypothetical protein